MHKQNKQWSHITLQMHQGHMHTRHVENTRAKSVLLIRINRGCNQEHNEEENRKETSEKVSFSTVESCRVSKSFRAEHNSRKTTCREEKLIS